jgi:hypothetical protein
METIFNSFYYFNSRYKFRSFVHLQAEIYNTDALFLEHLYLNLDYRLYLNMLISNVK